MGFLKMVLTASEQSAIDAIGGADGPTAILVANGAVWTGLLWLAGAAIIAYLLGSVDFGILISKIIYRDDVRKHGSGNAGSTNILRTYGKKAAILTLLGDMGKGAIAVLIGRALASCGFGDPSFGVYGGYVAAVFAVIGHMWPVWFSFKGGKGVAVAAGAILASEPIVFLVLAAVFLIFAFTTRIVSLSSIVVAACYPVFTALLSWYKDRDVLFSTVCTFVMAALVIWMHRSNIKRLLNGTEYKFGSKEKQKDKQDPKE